jgi:hypothetical protein
VIDDGVEREYGRTSKLIALVFDPLEGMALPESAGPASGDERNGLVA